MYMYILLYVKLICAFCYMCNLFGPGNSEIPHIYCQLERGVDVSSICICAFPCSIHETYLV